MLSPHSTGVINRLCSKTVWSGDCLLWTGAKRCHKGFFYGAIRGDGGRKSRMLVASRVALETKISRPLSAGEVAMHACDNPLCVNPDHLSVGSHRDNTQDMIKKSRHPTFTLSAEDANEIRRRCASGERQVDVAEIYKVHQSTVNKIVNGKRQKETRNPK